MHRYRSHTCGALREGDVGKDVRLSGWVHRVRDHGGLLFIDLRDHYGLTQVVADPGQPGLQGGRDGALRVGDPRRRQGARAARGHASTRSCRPARSRCSPAEIEVLSAAKELPVPVFGEPDYPEDLRLQVPLPRPAARDAARATSCCGNEIIGSIRRRMREAGFFEFQTPILTASSARRARATSWCRRACIRASSTPCRRRRSSSSS